MDSICNNSEKLLCFTDIVDDVYLLWLMKCGKHHPAAAPEPKFLAWYNKRVCYTSSHLLNPEALSSASVTKPQMCRHIWINPFLLFSPQNQSYACSCFLRGGMTWYQWAMGDNLRLDQLQEGPHWLRMPIGSDKPPDNPGFHCWYCALNSTWKPKYIFNITIKLISTFFAD